MSYPARTVDDTLVKNAKFGRAIVFDDLYQSSR